MLVRDFAQEIIADPNNQFTYANVWSPRGDTYEIHVDFVVWRAVHEKVRVLNIIDQAGLAASEHYTTNLMPALTAQLGSMAPGLRGVSFTNLQAAAVLSVVQAMFWLEQMRTPNKGYEFVESAE